MMKNNEMMKNMENGETSESSGSCFIREDVRSTNSYLRGLDVPGLMDLSFTAYDSDQSNNVNK